MSQFNDEHAGRGGSYVATADGTRVLQERTGHVAPEAQAKPAEAAPAKKTTTKGVNDAKSS